MLISEIAAVATLWSTPDRQVSATLECYETQADIKQEPREGVRRPPIEMSTASKVTLAVTSVVSLGIIWAVHNKQVDTLNKICKY